MRELEIIREMKRLIEAIKRCKSENSLTGGCKESLDAYEDALEELAEKYPSLFNLAVFNDLD